MTDPAVQPAIPDQGVTLRQAALVAGLGILIMAFAAPYAELVVYPSLVVPGNIEETTQNLLTSRGLFLAAIFCYLITFFCDLVVAWALYVLLAPANRSLSLLTAWFRLVYTVMALFGLLKLVTVFRLLNNPDHRALLEVPELHGQVSLLLNSFRYEWSLGSLFFGVHLGLLGFLVYRSGYVPRLLGILLLIDGFGHLIFYLSPYLYPDADLGFVLITFFGELIFMVWLLVRGGKIQHPTAHS